MPASVRRQRDRRHGFVIALWLLAAVLAGPVGAQSRDRQPGSAPPRAEGPMVEVAPIRCWWRTSAGAIAIGELFDVRLTCAVVETPSVQVVPDESRLTVANVQLTPFEVVGGEHPADTHAGQRRFFQYRYTLRLIDANEIGQDVSLPRLPISYKVESRVAADSTLAGRDFTYLLPGLSVRVLSNVPNDAFDIRDGADVGLERIEDLQFRARVFDIAAIALGAGAALLAVLAVVAIVGRARQAERRERARLSEHRVLGIAGAELGRLAREGRGGWTPDLIAAGHAALRIVGAIAAGRRISEQPLAAGAAPADGRIAVRSRLPGRGGVAISSPTTAADLARAVAALPIDAPAADRAGLESLQAALATFTTAQYSAGEAEVDPVALASALDAAQVEATRLARQRLLRWPRLVTPAPRRSHGAVRT